MKNMEKFWLFFILLQPVLDVGTSLMIQFTTFPITIGILVRVVFLMFAFLYVVKTLWDDRNKKYMLLFSAWIGYLALNFGINFFTKENFSFTTEAIFLTKSMYPVIVFIAAYLLITKKVVTKEKLLSIFTINGIIVSLFIIVPTMLDISFQSYSETLDGSIGWFNAANETGVILSILFVFSLLQLIYKEKLNVLAIISIVLINYSVFLIGTRVSIGAVLIMNIVFVVLHIFRKQTVLKALLVAIPFTVLLMNFNTAPVTVNAEKLAEQAALKKYMMEHLEEFFTPEEIVVIKKVEALKKRSYPVLTRVLSSRDLYVLVHYDYFKEASFARKVLGMGYASEYFEKPKTTEMDYFDFVFSYGILLGLVATILAVWKLGSLIIAIMKNLFNRTKRNKGFIVIGLGFLMTVSISFLAGHVFFAPAVSFYFAILAVLTLFTKEEVVS